MVLTGSITAYPASERSLYTHVLVDEYQNLNKAEQSFIALLSGGAEP